eukprot:525444-Amphidinium_carterae.1
MERDWRTSDLRCASSFLSSIRVPARWAPRQRGTATPRRSNVFVTPQGSLLKKRGVGEGAPWPVDQTLVLEALMAMSMQLKDEIQVIRIESKLNVQGAAIERVSKWRKQNVKEAHTQGIALREPSTGSEEGA